MWCDSQVIHIFFNVINIHTLFSTLLVEWSKEFTEIGGCGASEEVQKALWRPFKGIMSLFLMILCLILCLFYFIVFVFFSFLYSIFCRLTSNFYYSMFCNFTQVFAVNENVLKWCKIIKSLFGWHRTTMVKCHFFNLLMRPCWSS